MSEARKAVIGDIIGCAKAGERIVGYDDGKVWWAGLGNRSGLHSFADTLLDQKWAKSGARFTKRIEALPAGTRVIVQDFRNITRDRGRWVKLYTHTIPD
jgi:hypothetical protein